MTLQFKNRCNGLSLNAPRFSDTAKQTLREVLPRARQAFREGIGDEEFGGQGQYELGGRFYNDDRVQRTIEGAIEELEFMSDPYGWCLDGLRECASSDHWYTYEKQWD